MTADELKEKTAGAFRYLLGLINRHTAEIAELEADVHELRDTVSALETRLAAIEAEVL